MVSAALAIAAVLGVIFGLTQVVQDGLAPLPIAAAAAGLLIGMVWVRRQRRLADPMIDLGLFRLPTFNAALTVNFLAIFVAQYLQLVAGLTPFEAGLLSLPSAIGFVIGSQAAPRIVTRVRPPYLISGGLALGSLGLVLLTQVPTSGGLVPLVIASVVISLGLAPVFGLTTELIVGSAPPERAGAASGISETGAELGGALGLALLGSIGVALYRGGLGGALTVGLPAEAADAARGTLGGAVGVASSLPPETAGRLLSAARASFVDGMHVAAAIAAVVGLGLALFALVALRSRGAEPSAPEPEATERPRMALAQKPARECF